MIETFQPKVSIITVCLNSEKFIKKTIRSVREQTYKNINTENADNPNIFLERLISNRVEFHAKDKMII